MSTSDKTVVPFKAKSSTSNVKRFESHGPDNVVEFFESFKCDTALIRNVKELWSSLAHAMEHPVTLCYLTEPAEVSSIANKDIFICMTGPEDPVTDPVVRKYDYEAFLKVMGAKHTPLVNMIIYNFNVVDITYRRSCLTGDYFQLSVGNVGWNLRLVLEQ